MNGNKVLVNIVWFFCKSLQVGNNAGLHGFSAWLFIGVAVPTCILLIIGAAILFVTNRRQRGKESKGYSFFLL